MLTAERECCEISSATFNCDNQVYQSPFLQKVFPWVTFCIFFEHILQFKSLWKCVRWRGRQFISIKFFCLVQVRKSSWPCGHAFKQEALIPGSNLFKPAFFFPLSPILLFSFSFYYSYQCNNCLSHKTWVIFLQ